MKIHTNVSLKPYLTMKLGGNTRFMAEAHSSEDVALLCKRAHAQHLKVITIGGGSNLIATDDGFNGLIIKNKIMGIEVVSDTPSETTVRFGAGENWDEAVTYTVERNLSGIEAMSAIPGTVGAAPVQNIGAYGQELADTFIELEAYDTVNQLFTTLTFEDCKFAYRHSIFRGQEEGRYIIVSVTLRFFKISPQPPFYKALQTFLDNQQITTYTVKTIRNAVVAIRKDKLPDPLVKPNTGSFFKNAVVEKWLRDELKEEYIDMPSYELSNGMYKIPSGWLIERAGLKDSLLHGMRINKNNALVLINESASSYDDLAAARNEIIDKVRSIFRITLEQEPLEL